MSIKYRIMFLGILVFCSVFVFNNCGKKIFPAEKAGMEYCKCIDENHKALKKDVLNYCNDKIAKRYNLLRIYLNTRDKIIDTMYNRNTIDSMMRFVATFTKTVDQCNPPYWFKADTLR